MLPQRLVSKDNEQKMILKPQSVHQISDRNNMHEEKYTQDNELSVHIPQRTESQLQQLYESQKSLSSPCYLAKTSGEDFLNSNSSSLISVNNCVSESQIEDSIQPDKKNNSLLQLWKKGDSVFKGKYSTGATPKIEKEPLLSQSVLTRLHSTHTNSGIPSTGTENIPTTQNSQEISYNKFMNSLQGLNENVDESKSRGFRPVNEVLQKPFKLDAQTIGSPVKQTRRNGFGKNLFASKFSNESDAVFGVGVAKKLFSIPENNRMNEMEPESCDNLPSSLSTMSTIASNRNSCDDGNIKGLGTSNFDNVNMFLHRESSFELSNLGDSAYRRKDMEVRSRFEKDFEKCQILGSGCFGTVYKCMNRLDGLEYAVKIIKLKNKGVSFQSQAINEVHALALLSLDENPFFVRYFSAWFEEEQLHLVMEFCPSNLRNIERFEVKFSESMIRQILRDVCQGLRHLHKQNIVHLDIKPENILYSRTCKYKIADLGLSRIAERGIHEEVGDRDVRYVAPELLNESTENLPDLTKADIFSLGITIYELITRQELPKSGSEWDNIRSGKLPRLDNLKNYSNSLKGMIKVMMSPKPDKRPSANELITKFLSTDTELELESAKIEKDNLKKQLLDLQKKHGIKRKGSQ